MQTIQQMIEALSTLAQSPALRTDLREAANQAENILRAIRGELGLEWDASADSFYRVACNLNSPALQKQKIARLVQEAKAAPHLDVDSYLDRIALMVRD